VDSQSADMQDVCLFLDAEYADDFAFVFENVGFVFA
jgi:hypothetical protein